MKLEIEEDAVNSFKAQLNQMTRGNTDYETTNVKIEVADRAKETKIVEFKNETVNYIYDMITRGEFENA
jgi:hypothetical protein